MCIYNLLFYKSYQLAKYSKNFDDFPVLGGVVFVIACLMFNIFTILFFLDGADVLPPVPLMKKWKIPIFAVIVVIFTLTYYLYKERYKKMLEKYENKGSVIRGIHPVIIIFLYYGISVGLIFIAAMYKNNDGIFG